MNSDNQNASERVRDAMLTKLEAASSVEELRDMLRAIEQARDVLGLETSAKFATVALDAISRLTVESPEIAIEVMRENLLPWCLTPKNEGEASPHFGYELHRLRHLLNKWVYQFPNPQMPKVRSAILDDIQNRLEVEPSNEALWAISTIGYRTSQITALLSRLLKEGGELSDAVLATTVALGVEPDERERLLGLVQARLAAGDFTHGIRRAVQELVGPHRIELAIDLLQLAAEKHPDENHVDFSFAVGAATSAVERCADNEAVQDEAWAILRNHFKTVRQTSEYACRCDTKATVIDHVDWLLTKEWASDADTGAYIMLSRLGELAKPQQLKGWDEVDSGELTALLERLAKMDTGMTGQYATTISRLKTEAWETALTIGNSCIEDWIDASIMGETNPYVVHDIAEIVSCLRCDRLPQHLLDAISAEATTDDDNGKFFRQTGLTDVAQSSCSRAAFDSMLQFGLTHEGHVLFSTIDAIVDIAIVRFQEGDTDVVERLLEMTTTDNEMRHREAGVSGFCQLCKRGFVREEQLDRLWHFANASDLDDYWRCQALEAIGFADFEEATAWSDRIRQIAARDESDFGWRACEVLIRRNWITADDEVPLFARLGLAAVGGEMKVSDPARIDGWQAFLIGLLFRKDKDRFQTAVSDLLVHAPTDVVHQLLDSLRQHGEGCPDQVSLALVRRIRESNDKASADTELIHVLATIAPSTVLTLSRVFEYADWLVEARTALCEAIRTIASDHEAHRNSAVECLLAFMRDASFQVRRSACRAISLWGGNRLESICTTWSQSTDVELRKRAAEAVAWLPISAFSDERLYDFGFAWDPEPFVRKIWNDVLSARRQREWANKYVDSIVSAAADDNQSIVDAYRYGRALAKIGDDDSVRRIEAVLPTQAFRPNARHWLRKIASEIKMNWKKVTDKWPEPWAHEQGMIEELNGAIVMRNGTPVNAKLSLWCRVRSGPSDLGAWGGVAEDVDRVFPFHFETGEVEIQIPGRPPARATVFESHWSSRSRARLVLHGSSPYPAKLHAQQTESEKSLVDTVAEIVRETPVDGTIGDAEQVILRLQPLLKRVGMSVFSLPPEYDTGLRVKAACQEAALVVRTIAEALPRTFLSSVALWRIANAILEAESLALRLTPAELVTFGTTARLGDRESPDELLFWMMDRVESERSKDPTRQRHASKSS